MSRPIVTSLTALVLGACTFSLPQDDDEPVWELIFEDEFDGDAGDPPNPDHWTHDVGDGTAEGIPGWGNRELQYYTDGTANVALNGEGQLVITARRNDPPFVDPDTGGEFEWTSARINSKDKVEFRYGRVDVRVRAPQEPGIWPAVWMLGADLDENPWPVAGEVDILEVFGTNSVVVGALHGPGYSGGAAANTGELEDADEFGAEFHDIQLFWDPEHLLFVLDDEVVGTLSRADLFPGAGWAADYEMFMLLNVAVGGNAGAGNPNFRTPDETRMLVDHIRVYQRTDPIGNPFLAGDREPEVEDEASGTGVEE